MDYVYFLPVSAAQLDVIHRVREEIAGWCREKRYPYHPDYARIRIRGDAQEYMPFNTEADAVEFRARWL